MNRLCATVLFGLTFVTLVPRPARAEDDTSAADKARALFREGRTLAGDGKFDEACRKFEESLKLDDGIGTRFNLAECLVHTGHVKQAQSMFFRVADLAHDKGQADREQIARERGRALDEKLLRLGIEAKEVADGLEVLVDGKAIDRANWASGERVDPGKHDIVAKAPHKKSWSLQVELGTASPMLMITVPKLEDEPAKKAPVPAKQRSAESDRHPDVPRHASVPARRTKPSPAAQVAKVFFLGGAGAGVVLAATGFAIYKMSNDNAKDVCPSSTGCTPDDIQRHEGFVDDAATARGLGYLGLGIAGGSLIGFTVLSLGSQSGREAPPGTAVSAGPLQSGGWGASMRGRF